jgi:O-antigen/teichoic acid export membrane protein
MSLRRNALWNLTGAAAPLLIGAITIPYLIEKTGVESFGVLTLVWALIGYFSLFDFGLGRALTQQVAATRSTGELTNLPSLVKTGVWLTAVTGIVGGIILAALTPQLAENWLSVSKSLQPSTEHALLLAAIGIPLTTVTTGLRGILEAYEDFKVVSLLRIGLGAANFGLPAISVLIAGNSLAWMVASLVAARAIAMVGHMWHVNKKLPVGWASAHVSSANIRALLSFGVWMTISNIVGPLMVTADRFFISGVLGAAVVAYYTVPFEVVIRVLILPGAVMSVVFPRLAAVIRSDRFEARRLYRKTLAIVTVALLPVCLVIALGSKLGLRLWLGEAFAEQSWAIVCVMALGLLLNGIASVPFAAIQATGDARKTAYLHMFELIIYVPILYASMKFLGLIGAAIAWTVRVTLDLIFLLIYAQNKKL